MSALRILLVHDVGHAEANPVRVQRWQDAIEISLREFDFKGTSYFKHGENMGVMRSCQAALLEPDRGRIG